MYYYNGVARSVSLSGYLREYVEAKHAIWSAELLTDALKAQLDISIATAKRWSSFGAAGAVETQYAARRVCELTTSYE